MRRSSWAQRRLLAEACLLLMLARAAVRLLPFRRIIWLLRLRPAAAGAPVPARSPAGADLPAGAAARTAARAVHAAAARVPGGGNCLAQALAGAVMLRRRGVGTTIQLGVAVTDQDRGGMIAHAWLQCGATILTGEAGAAGFIPVAAIGCDAGSRLRKVR